ncbi:MAG: ABC transporter permease, partial [Paracoccaceae bacterium]
MTDADADSGPLLRLAPRLTIGLLAVPVLAGTVGTFAPAFGLMQEPGLEAFRALFDWPGIGRAMWLSVVTGTISTLLALLISLGLVASLIGRRGFGVVQRLLSPLLAVPHAAAALGLAFLIAPSGWIARALSPWATGWSTPPDLLILNDPAGMALTFGLIAKETPFLLLMILAALPQTDAARRLTVATSLGYGRLTGFAMTVLPALYSQLRLPVYAVLAYGMTTVDMALVLGPTLPPTLSAQITLWAMDPSLTERSTAAAGAVLQLALVAGVLGIWRLCEGLIAQLLRHAASTGRRGVIWDRIGQPLVLTVGLLPAFALTGGLVGLAVCSVAGLWQFPDAPPNALTLKTWEQTGPDLWSATWATVGLATASTAVALWLVLACLEAEHRRGLPPGAGVLWLLYLPLIVPQVAFLPGLQMLALASGVQSGWLQVAVAHLVFVLPYVFLSLAAPFRA